MLTLPSLLAGFPERSAAPPESSPAPADIWLKAWRRFFPCLLPPVQQAPEKSHSFGSPISFSSRDSPPSPSAFSRQPESLGMPYTPPSHSSPTSTTRSSPDVSRRSSINGSTVGTGSSGLGSGSGSKPALPRSASYLTKYRRTPMATAPSASATLRTNLFSNSTPPGTSADSQVMGANQLSDSIRQSPPPITDSHIMPAGAMISPPDSQSSSEDEGSAEDNRGRQIENLKELQDAISALPQHRESSPDHASPGDLLVLPSQIGDLVDAVSQEFDAEIRGRASKMCPRKIAHSRSSTDPMLFRSKSAGASPTISEDSDQDVPPKKPQMVRKKSGELVRPALRPAASKRRPSSMPGTPTFSKAVHFDSHLEHVRHFLQVDRPLAVSTGSSPADNYESDTEYPFFDEKGSARSPPYEWELIINNFPQDSPIRKSMPIRVERVWMSNDQKFLHGSIAVANLAFQKFVVCRFTFDYWKTVSEVTAEYSHEIRPRESEQGHDRFQFTIKLSDLANLESKTLFFCVKYIVNGLEYWDNNNHLNFQVDFRKKMLPQNGKNNFQGAAGRNTNALPRTRRSTASRSRMTPVDADDFGDDTRLMKFDQPIHEYLGETASSLRLKSSKSTSSLPSDNLANRLSAPSGLAFANRYDFGASLSAAKQANKESNGSPRSRAPDVLYMKPKASFGPPVQTSLNKTKVEAAGSPVRPPPSKVPGTESPASSTIASASYEEIVNKYCFFNGSKQSSPQLKDGTMRNGRYDGATDNFFTLTASNGSSPDVDIGRQNGSLEYTAQQKFNPYFQNAQIAIGPSPDEAWSSSKSSPPMVRSGSPIASDFDPFGSNIDAPFGPHLSDRFPFTTDTHPSPAIRG